MKTTVLFRMIVLVAMVFAGIANTTVKAQGNNFITNEEKVDDLVKDDCTPETIEAMIKKYI